MSDTTTDAAAFAATGYTDMHRIVRATRGLRYSGMVRPLPPDPSLADVADWLEAFSDTLARHVDAADADATAHRSLRDDVAAMRRVLGTVPA